MGTHRNIAIQSWCRQLIYSSLLLFASSVSADQGMSFKYVRQTIYAAGQIEENTAANFRYFVQQNNVPEGTTVALSSPGGSLIGGITLGQTIRDLKYETNVYGYAGAEKKRRNNSTDDALAQLHEDRPADCSSACVYAYVGGVQRNLYFGSRLGIHQFYFQQNDDLAKTGDVQVLSAAIVAHLSAMGVKPELFSAASLFAKNEMRYLSLQEAEDYAIVNHGILHMKFSYGVSLGRPYPQYSYETPDGKFTLALLCNGKSLHIGASREHVRHNFLSANEDVYYFFLDDTPSFKMDRHVDSFHREVDSEFLRELFASRKVQTWTEAGGLALDGGQFRIEDWEPFIDYAKDCK